MSASPRKLNRNEVCRLTGKQREIAVRLADSVNSGQKSNESWEQRRLFAVSARSIDLPEGLQDGLDSLRQLLFCFLPFGRTARHRRSRDHCREFDLDNPLR